MSTIQIVSKHGEQNDNCVAEAHAGKPRAD